MFDNAEISPANVRVTETELENAHQTVDQAFLDVVRRVRDALIEFQSAIVHRDRELESSTGAVLAQRYTPLHRVGLCIPGGAAAYPSSVLMTAVPAQVAGVPEIAVVAPPTPLGASNPQVLATCHELGIQEVYRIGGAQGVAALAYGVHPIRKVDKIVGPGNLFVALAKKHVFGHVDIDSIAGPSEVTIIVDETAEPSWVATDLIAQAEHAPGSAVLIGWDGSLVESILAEVRRLVPKLDRQEAIEFALTQYSAAFVVRDRHEAIDLTNRIAPEHLQLCVRDPEALAKQTVNAGATFLGNYTPVALGDYVAGPSHVLPTGGTARWASGLSVNSFLRSRSLIAYDREALERVASDVEQLATCEQLGTHALSVRVRK